MHWLFIIPLILSDIVRLDQFLGRLAEFASKYEDPAQLLDEDSLEVVPLFGHGLLELDCPVQHAVHSHVLRMVSYMVIKASNREELSGTDDEPLGALNLKPSLLLEVEDLHVE